MIDTTMLYDSNITEVLNNLFKKHNLTKQNHYEGLMIDLLYQVKFKDNMRWNISLNDLTSQNQKQKYDEYLLNVTEYQFCGLYLVWINPKTNLNERITFTRMFNFEKLITQLRKFCKQKKILFNAHFQFDDYLVK